MIMHILKKDLKLVWPAVAAVLVLKCIAVWTFMQTGIFSAQPNVQILQAIVDIGSLLAPSLAIIWAVQSEPIVSDNADWLTRPVSRLNLTLAKTLLALAVTFVPVFAGNLLFGLWRGLPFADDLLRSIPPAITAFFTLGLPAMALGAITSSRIQAIGVVGAMFIVFAVAMVANLGITHSIMFARGLWSIRVLQMAMIVGASMVVIGLQYSRRLTFLSRGIFAAAATVLIAMSFIPWDMALQLQHVIDGKATDAPIKVAFDAQARMGAPAADRLGTPTLYVPLTLTKTEGSIANTDSRWLRLQSADGHVLYNNPAGIAETRSGEGLTTVARDPSSLSSKATYTGVAIVTEDYARFKGQTVRASLTYYFTAFQASAPIQVVVRPMQRQIIDHLGICEARRNAQNPTYTDLYCFARADQAACVGSTVRYTDTGKVVPLKIRCPFPSRSSDPDIMTPAYLATAYPTPTGNVAVQLTLTPYRLRNHFAQTVEVPPTHLENLTPPSSGGQ